MSVGLGRGAVAPIGKELLVQVIPSLDETILSFATKQNNFPLHFRIELLIGLLRTDRTGVHVIKSVERTIPDVWRT